MEITKDERIKILEQMLFDFKKKIVDIEFTIRFNDGEKIKNPNLAEQISQIRLKLDRDKRQTIRLAEKIEHDLNELKLKPLEEDLKNNQTKK